MKHGGGARLPVVFCMPTGCTVLGGCAVGEGGMVGSFPNKPQYTRRLVFQYYAVLCGFRRLSTLLVHQRWGNILFVGVP